KAVILLVQTVRHVPPARERAVEPVRPGMVRAHEPTGVAGASEANAGTAMTADVVQRPDARVVDARSNYDQVVAEQFDQKKVPFMRYARDVPNVDPVPRQKRLDLGLEHVFIQI